MAFACIFLPDNQLREFLHNLQTEVINNGDLSGILVTGKYVVDFTVIISYLTQ